jgi:hypothetical protein
MAMQFEDYPSLHDPVKAGPEDKLITSAEQRARWGGISRATEERRLRDDPAWPKPIYVHHRRYYRDAESREHRARVISGEQS